MTKLTNTVFAFAAALIVWFSPFSLSAQTNGDQSPGCRVHQLRTTFEGSGGAMGSNYTGIQFKNVSRDKCRLESNFSFEQFDSRGIRMAIKVINNASVNNYGEGSREIILSPQQEIAITVQSVNRTGYDESRRCAVKMQISKVNASVESLLLSYPTISCQTEIWVTGFHSAK